MCRMMKRLATVLVSLLVACTNYQDGVSREEFFKIYTNPNLPPHLRVDKYREFVHMYPSSKYADDALYWIGVLYRDMGNFDLALDFWHKLLKDFPQSEWADDALYWCGVLQRIKAEKGNSRQEWEKAIKYFDKIAKDFPKSVWAEFALYQKGYCLEKLGRSEEAWHVYKKILARYTVPICSKEIYERINNIHSSIAGS